MRSRSRAKGWLVGAIVAVLIVPMLAWGQEEEPFDVELDGRKTWTIRYGFGHPLGLAATGVNPGQLTLDQTLAVDILGEALSILTLEAHFDDQLPEQMQSLTVTLDTERLDGIFGDFLATGFESFTAFGRKMKGLRLDYTMGSATLTGIASKLEGVAQTKTFVGETAADEIVFAATSPANPDASMPYLRHIAGLYAYPISALYVPEFSEVNLAFRAEAPLAAVLEGYGVGYLAEVLAAGPSSPLETREFIIVGEGEQVLLLALDGLDLVRDRLKDAIGTYNDEYRPEGEDKKSYPFAPGTDYEKTFLERVAASVSIDVDDASRPLLSAVRERYYRLGREDINAGSVDVSIRLDGEPFQPIGGAAFPDYRFTLYPAAGVVELDFPPDFFDREGSVRIAFDYAVSGGAFTLGLSVIPGSERVTLNGELLERDVDYQIDYEVGMIFLLAAVGETDVVQIDYELYSGGLGAAASYASYLFGLQLDWEISDALHLTGSLLQVAEDPGSVADPETASTMPNRHTLAALAGHIDLDDLDADFLIGASNDRFPFDDNARAHKVNEITSIASVGGLLLFGHRAGLTALDAGGWTTYGVGNGLAGRMVSSIAGEEDAAYVGTHAGLTVLLLEGDAPLEYVGNWQRYTENDGLPGSAIGALLLVDETLWIGTSDGLAFVETDEFAAARPAFAPVEAVGTADVRALASSEGVLYVGTARGVMAYSLTDGSVSLLAGTETEMVIDLHISDGTLYVASERGLRGYRNGIGVGWIVIGQRVDALGLLDGDLIYATGDGLINAKTGEMVLGGASISAIGESDDALWLGSRADASFELRLWRLGDAAVAYTSEVTGIDGEDPFGYVDTLASEHTAQGVTANASFRHAGTGYSITGMVDATAPSYRTLGSLRRSDSVGWDVTSTIDLEEETALTLTHAYRTIGAGTADPSGHMENTLSLSGSFGPALSLIVQHERLEEDSRSAGAESSRIKYALTLTDSLFADAAKLTLNWNDGYAWSPSSESVRRSTRLAMSGDIDLLPGLGVHADWRRPMQAEDETRTGSESFSWRAEWDGETRIGDVEIEHESNWARDSLDSSGEWEHSAELGLGLGALALGTWQHTPSIDLEAKYEQNAGTIGGRASLRSKTEGISIQTTARADLTGIGKPVLRPSGKLSSTVSYGAIEDLSASLTAAVDRSATIYAGASKAAGGLSVTGRMTWAPDTGHYDSLSFSWRASGAEETRRVTGTLTNSYRLDLMRIQQARLEEDAEESEEVVQSAYPTVILQADTAANLQWIGEDLRVDGSIAARLDAALSQTWSAGISATYLVGTTSENSLYHSLLLEATVAIDF